MTYDEFVDMLDFAFDKPYNWLMIDRDNNTYWKKFDRVIINNNKKIKNNMLKRKLYKYHKLKHLHHYIK